MDVENKMVIDSQWDYLENDCFFENTIEQSECNVEDFYGMEILEGDQVAIDQDNFNENILKEHLKQYCVEQMNFIFKGGWVIDKNGFDVFEEQLLEKYLHEQYNFKFSIAE
jgi:hypothetical protein